MGRSRIWKRCSEIGDVGDRWQLPLFTSHLVITYAFVKHKLHFTPTGYKHIYIIDPS